MHITKNPPKPIPPTYDLTGLTENQFRHLAAAFGPSNFQNRHDWLMKRGIVSVPYTEADREEARALWQSISATVGLV